MRREDPFGPNTRIDRIERIAGQGQGGGDVDRILRQIGTLADSEEARALLGVDAILADQVDVAFLNDPYEWVANDIAAAIKDANYADSISAGNTETPLLATLVAEYRLCQLLLGRVDDTDLASRVRTYLAQ
jgi:hypothetical protein